MGGLFGSVHRELGKSGLHGTLFRALQQHPADTQALMVWINRELVRHGNAVSGEVLACAVPVRGLNHDGSDQPGFGDDYEATATLQPRCGDLRCLIDRGVVQTHPAQTRIGAVQQRREFVDRI